MIKQFYILLLLVCSSYSFSQKLVYKSNGNITDSENQKISPDQVRELLVNNEKLLADYNAGRSKKTAGNILLYGGSALILTDMITNLSYKQKIYRDENFPGAIIGVKNRIYPSVFTYIGIGAIVASIPLKIGFSKKIKNVVTDYNNLKATGNVDFNQHKLDLITNSNGIGFRLTLN